MFHFTKYTKNNFIYSTPKPAPNDSIIRVIMLLYCDKAAILA